MKRIFVPGMLALLVLVMFSSCSKTNEMPPPTQRPPTSFPPLNLIASDWWQDSNGDYVSAFKCSKSCTPHRDQCLRKRCWRPHSHLYRRMLLYGWYNFIWGAGFRFGHEIYQCWSNCTVAFHWPTHYDCFQISAINVRRRNGYLHFSFIFSCAKELNIFPDQ